MRSSSHSFGPSQWAFKHSLACHICFFNYPISFPPLVSHFEHGCFTLRLIKLSIDWGLEESLSNPSINLHWNAISIFQLRLECKGAFYKCVLLVSVEIACVSLPSWWLYFAGDWRLFCEVHSWLLLQHYGISSAQVSLLPNWSILGVCYWSKNSEEPCGHIRSTLMWVEK